MVLQCPIHSSPSHIQEDSYLPFPSALLTFFSLSTLFTCLLSSNLLLISFFLPFVPSSFLLSLPAFPSPPLPVLVCASSFPFLRAALRPSAHLPQTPQSLARLYKFPLTLQFSFTTGVKIRNEIRVKQ